MNTAAAVLTWGFEKVCYTNCFLCIEAIGFQMQVCVNSVETGTASKQKVLTACFKYLVKSNGLRDYMLLKNRPVNFINPPNDFRKIFLSRSCSHARMRGK
jgi:hypothetical protein